ncbi:MAG: hypothetical protein ACK4NS_12315 [Saprospiraceae bacterium]
MKSLILPLIICAYACQFSLLRAEAPPSTSGSPLRVALAFAGFAPASDGVCGHADAWIELRIFNAGSDTLSEIQAELPLAAPGALGAMLLGLSAPLSIVESVGAVPPQLHPDYNGANSTQLFVTGGALNPGGRLTLRFRATLHPDAPAAPNAPRIQAQVWAESKGVAFFDLSDGGPDPLSANVGYPGDTGGTDDPTFLGPCLQLSQNYAGNSLISISISPDCEAPVNSSMLIEGLNAYCTEAWYPLGGFFTIEITTPQGAKAPNPIPASFVGQTLRYAAQHVLTCVTTHGLIQIEDKLPPKLTCADISVPCIVTQLSPAELYGALQIEEAWPQVADCSAYTLTYSDEWLDLNCDNPQGLSSELRRTWSAVDQFGNQSVCQQQIAQTRLTLADVIFPDDVNLSCLNPDTDPAQTGAPYAAFAGQIFTIFPSAAYCELQSVFNDEVFAICDGSQKIVRNWTVIDWCAPTSPDPLNPNPKQRVQIIKTTDAQGPQFVCPKDLTVSIDPGQCDLAFAMPSIIVSDSCSRIHEVEALWGAQGDVLIFSKKAILSDFPGNNPNKPDTLAVLGVTAPLAPGQYRFEYRAIDDCGQSSACQFSLAVVDAIPPAVACDEWTKIGLGADGVALISAATFDDGSYDACGPVFFKARRLQHSACSDTLFFDDIVRFCCADIGDTILVELRVYDIEPPKGPMGPAAFAAHHSACLIKALVEDKVRPACIPPPDVTVSCVNFDPSLWAYGKAIVSDNCCLDTQKVYLGQIGLTHTPNYTLFDTTCNRGTIIRTFRAWDCYGNVSQCNQKIVTQYEQGYFIRFPDDKIVNLCDGTGSFGEPVIKANGCEIIGFSYEDVIFTLVTDACYRIERNWTIINWCTYNPNMGCIFVPNPDISIERPFILPGPIVSPVNTPSPWSPTIVKVHPSDPDVTNYSIFWSPNANCYKYTQIIVIQDLKPPTLNCPSGTDTHCDLTDNDPLLWSGPSFYDSQTEQHDLCEGPADLSVNASDACTGSNINFRYLLFLDLDNNGELETVVNSALPPPPGFIQIGNALTPNFAGGAPIEFDRRAVPTSQKYQFAVETFDTGNSRTARVRWNTPDAPNTYVTPELPYGKHKIKWIANDGCGGEKSCEYMVEVKDCKKPTVVCINGLSVNVMQAGFISLWANDFLQYGSDNCTPASKLRYGIRRSGTGLGFPFAANGIDGNQEVAFHCSELGLHLVELWAIDLAGNADFCQTYVLLQSTTGICDPIDPVQIAGHVKTEEAKGVEDVWIQLQSMPGQTQQILTGDAGAYLFQNSLIPGSHVELQASKNTFPLNGVTTFDLVLINRHILGQQLLNSPYKLLAADINKSGTITTFDIVELRKLILGIYDEFPQNTSWRFVDAKFVFPNPQNPWDGNYPIFTEKMTWDPLLFSQPDADWIAVKIGDVNNSAAVGALQGKATGDRENGDPLPFLCSLDEAAGGSVRVEIAPPPGIVAWQTTLEHPDLELTNIQLPPGVGSECLSPHSQALTLSIGESDAPVVLFFRKKAGDASPRIAFSDRLTQAAAYREDGIMRRPLAVFSQKNMPLEPNPLLALCQPNPWTERAALRFFMPKADEATISLFDDQGRLCWTQSGSFAQGWSEVTLHAGLARVPGAYFCRIETGEYAQIIKMQRF